MNWHDEGRRTLPCTSRAYGQPLRGPLLHGQGGLHACFVVPRDVAADFERARLLRGELDRHALARVEFDLRKALYSGWSSGQVPAPLPQEPARPD